MSCFFHIFYRISARLVSKWLKPSASQARSSSESIQTHRLFVPSQVVPDNWAEEKEDIWLIWTVVVLKKTLVWRNQLYFEVGGAAWVKRGRRFICNFIWFIGIYFYLYYWSNYFSRGRNRLLLKILICSTVQAKRKMITPVSCCSAISLPVGKEHSFPSALIYYKNWKVE